MDSLMEKLRAAAPEVKDKREARRRARQRSNGSRRTASNASAFGPDTDIPGIPPIHKEEDEGETPSSPIEEGGLTTPILQVNGGDGATDEADPAAVAKRLLLGLRGPEAGDGSGTDDDLSKRRKENAETDRRSRRERRARGVSRDGRGRATSPALEIPTTQVVDNIEGENDAADVGSSQSNTVRKALDTPTTIVSPPPEDD